MPMAEEIFEKALLLLSDEVSEAGKEGLRLLSTAAGELLSRRLKPEVKLENIHETFVTAAAMMAISMYAKLGNEEFSSVRVGNITVSKGSGKGMGETLSAMAEELMSGLCGDGGAFEFRGVCS